MNILILGGTGAMGKPLVKMLSLKHVVYVTSRQAHQSTENVRYLQGNAKNRAFLLNVLSMHCWDAIIDFMVYSENEFEDYLPYLLNETAQYIFISSARVYAESSALITEDTPRLLDTSTDADYLKTNEYALAKAREENLIINSGKTNYTIIRPSITYNTYRLQLGVLEKENWLYRALHGRSIVFSKDVCDKLTTLTLGSDVAKGIAAIIGQREALGNVYHITYPRSLSWGRVLEIYLQVLRRYLGDDRKISVIMTEKSTNLTFKEKIYQLIYCRYFNRTFDNSKIAHFCEIQSFMTPEQGLTSCLSQFLENPKFLDIDWRIEAVNDRVAGEYTPLSEIPSKSGKVYYLLYRYDLRLLRILFEFLLKVKVKVKRVIK